MQIKKIYIDGYKNLVNTSIEVQSTDIPLAIIGNNGTGKSNLIEALLHIFMGLFYGNPPDFNFIIQYTAHGKDVSITRKIESAIYSVVVDGRPWSWSKFKKRIRETELMPPFPALVFCYYSGTCDRVKALVKSYNRSYQAKLRSQTENLERLFVFSDVDQAEKCLLGLFAHRYQKMLDRLSLGGVNKFKITLKPPESFMPETDDPSYWGTTGAMRDFIADLHNCAREGYEPYERLKSAGLHELRTYVFNLEGIEKVGATLERRGTNLFSMLQFLDNRKMLHEISFQVIHAKSGAVYGVDQLSEGEKQLLCVIGGLTLSQQNECLVLMDEPDTHINPIWSWEYDSLLKEALNEEQQQRSTIAMATHDPVLISGLNREQVLIARLDEGGRLLYKQPVRNPRGQGIANLLCSSEFFGLPSSLDKETQKLLDERLKISIKQELSDKDKARLKALNQQLEIITPGVSERDPDYVEFLRQRHPQGMA